MSGPVFYKAPPHSVTVQGAYEPFNLQIARNQIMGHDHIDLFGYSTAVGSTAWAGDTSPAVSISPSSNLRILLLYDFSNYPLAVSLYVF